MNATRIIVIFSLFSLLVGAPRSAAATSLNSEREIAIRRALCDIYEKLDNKRCAMQQYLALSLLAPEDADAQYRFGMFLARQKEHGLAVRNLKRATQLNPEVADYWVQLGNEYLQLRNYQGAADAFQQAGPKYLPQVWGVGNFDFPRSLKQYEDYNKRLKERQEDR